jgi:hypothetical protein
MEGNNSKQNAEMPRAKLQPQNMGTSSVALEHFSHYNKTA